MSTSTIKRHPIRGFFGGLCAGIGATMLLISYAKAPFGEATGWLPLVILVVVGVLIGLFAPARPGGGAHADTVPPPAPATPAAETETAPTEAAAPPETSPDSPE